MKLYKSISQQLYKLRPTGRRRIDKIHLNIFVHNTARNVVALLLLCKKKGRLSSLLRCY